MENRTKMKLGILAAMLLLFSASATYGVYSATNQTATYNGQIGFTATPNVDAKIEVFVNEGVEADSTITFAKAEATQNKTSSINLAWVLGDTTTAADDYCKVNFKITNTSVNYGLTATFTSTAAAGENNIKETSAYTVPVVIATGDNDTVEFSYKIKDVDLDANIDHSWSIGLTASK